MINSSGFGRKPNEPLWFSTSRVFRKVKKGECVSDVIASSDFRSSAAVHFASLSDCEAGLASFPSHSRNSFLVCGDVFFALLNL